MVKCSSHLSVASASTSAINGLLITLPPPSSSPSCIFGSQDSAPVVPFPPFPHIQCRIEWLDFIDVTNSETKRVITALSSLGALDMLHKQIMLLNSLTEDDDTPLLESHPVPFPFVFDNGGSFFSRVGIATSSREVALSYVYACIAAHLLADASSLKYDSVDFRQAISRSFKYYTLAKSKCPSTLDEKLVHPMIRQHYEHFYNAMFELMCWGNETTKPPGEATAAHLQFHIEILSRIYKSLTSFRPYHVAQQPKWLAWCDNMILWTKKATAVVVAAWLNEQVHPDFKDTTCESTAKRLVEIDTLLVYASMPRLKNWVLATDTQASRKIHFDLDSHNYAPVFINDIEAGTLFTRNYKPDKYVILQALRKRPTPADLIEGYRRFAWRAPTPSAY